MTDETKKLFDAPWEADVCCEIHDKNESLICICCPGEPHIANRLARLPELFDALMYFVVNDCPHAFISNDECRLCPDKQCKTREAVELLRKVRYGK